MDLNVLHNTDSISGVKSLDKDSIHLILSDIPYGIGKEDWDVLHNNTNSAYLGTSPAQQKAGNIFKHRGKPLNGWSEADKEIPRQYFTWVTSWAPSWYECLCPGGSVFVFAGRRLAHRCIIAFEDAGFIFKDMIAWHKSQAPFRAQRISVVYERRNDYTSRDFWEGWRVGNLAPIFEPILWFTKPYKIGTTLADNIKRFGVGGFNEKTISKYKQSTSNIIQFQYNKKDSGLHPTQKPLLLMEYLIELTTLPGQIVMDPFAGSATTLIAALRLKRKYIGYENNLDYYNKAKERLENEIKDLKNDLFSKDDLL